MPIAKRTSVSITTYQWRGRKNEGTKCLSSHRWLAPSAQARSATPIDATRISASKRAP